MHPTNTLYTVQCSEPTSSFLFAYNYANTKEEYLKELLSRSWGEQDKPLWSIDGSSENPTSSTSEELISKSLDSIQSKFGPWNFQQTSRSFRHRCGDYVDTPITDINATYIWLQLNSDFFNKIQKSKFLYSLQDPKTLQPVEMSIQKIFLLLANHHQAILILELKHSTNSVEQVLLDIHPFQKSLTQCFISLRRKVPSQFYKPENNPTVEQFRYLTKYLTPIATEKDGAYQDTNPCPLLGFFGWLLFDNFDAPDSFSMNQKDLSSKNYAIYQRLSKTHTLYRMHHLGLDLEDWKTYKSAIAFYLRRGSKIEQTTFQEFKQNPDVVKESYRSWDHVWSISRDAIVSISHNKQTEYSFVNERFLKAYQLLTLQVLMEYLGCNHFSFHVGKIAYKKQDKAQLTELIQNMNRFRLGTNLVDFSRRSSESEFYDNLRQVFNIELLVAELSREVKDVLSILKMIHQEEKELLKEVESKQTEHRDTILALIGATTIPFAIFSGLMGMNTDTSRVQGVHSTCGFYGKVPCWTFNEVVLGSSIAGLVIFICLLVFLRSGNPSVKKNTLI